MEIIDIPIIVTVYGKTYEVHVNEDGDIIVCSENQYIQDGAIRHLAILEARKQYPNRL